MEMDLNAAISFVQTHGRVLDRRRLGLLLGDGSPGDVLAALDAYRNPDGGYGWALEPDQRSATSQPVAAMHALEVLADIRDTKSRRPVELCEWLSGHTLPDGGVPFGLPCSDTAGSAPHWVEADATVSSLQMTAQLRRPGPSTCPTPRRHRGTSVAGRRHRLLPGADRPGRRRPARLRTDVRDALPRRGHRT